MNKKDLRMDDSSVLIAIFVVRDTRPFNGQRARFDQISCSAPLALIEGGREALIGHGPNALIPCEVPNAQGFAHSAGAGREAAVGTPMTCLSVRIDDR
jgi:hypothetical protein